VGKLGYRFFTSIARLIYGKWNKLLVEVTHTSEQRRRE
jgi:hypothetical protein